MNNQQIIRCLHECATKLEASLDISKLESVDIISRLYDKNEFPEFKRDLVEAGNESGIVFVEKYINENDLKDFLKGNSSPFLVFIHGKQEIYPAFINEKKGKYTLELITEGGDLRPQEGLNYEDISFHKNDSNETLTLSLFKYQSFSGKEGSIMTPVLRLFTLLSAEKKDIFYVYVYAALIGLVSLSLPLGIQAAVELISGGVVFSSVYLLISLIIIGTLGTGVLQVLQITIVELKPY